jgi:hypothetical protein
MMENSIVPPDFQEPGVQPVRMRTSFRVLSWILGPFMLLGPGIFIYETVLSAIAGRWAEAGWLLGMATFSLAGGMFGWRLLRAARNGIDPFSEDEARADAERRAMLAALRATGDERPELPRRLRA